MSGYDDDMFGRSSRGSPWLPNMEAAVRNQVIPGMYGDMSALTQMAAAMQQMMQMQSQMGRNFGYSNFGNATMPTSSWAGGYQSLADDDMMRAKAVNTADVQHYLYMTDPRSRLLAQNVFGMSNPGANTLNGLGYAINNVPFVSNLMGGSTNSFALASGVAMQGNITINPNGMIDGNYQPDRFATRRSVGVQQAIAQGLLSAAVDEHGFSKYEGISVTEMGHMATKFMARGDFGNIGMNMTKDDSGKTRMAVDDSTKAKFESVTSEIGEMAKQVKALFGPDGLSGNVEALVKALGGADQSITKARKELTEITARARSAGRDEREVLNSLAGLSATLRSAGMSEEGAMEQAKGAISQGLANSYVDGSIGKNKISDKQVSATLVGLAATYNADATSRDRQAAALFSAAGYEGANSYGDIQDIIKSAANGDASTMKVLNSIYEREGGASLATYMQRNGMGNDAFKRANLAKASSAGTRSAYAYELAKDLNVEFKTGLSTATVGKALQAGLFVGDNMTAILDFTNGKITEEELSKKLGEEGMAAFKTYRDEAGAGFAGSIRDLSENKVVQAFSGEKAARDSEESAARTLHNLVTSPPAGANMIPLGEQFLKGMLAKDKPDSEIAKSYRELAAAASVGKAPEASRNLLGPLKQIEMAGKGMSNLSSLDSVKAMFADEKFDKKQFADKLLDIANSGFTDKSRGADWAKRIEKAKASGDMAELTKVFDEMGSSSSDVERTGVYNIMSTTGGILMQEQVDATGKRRGVSVYDSDSTTKGRAAALKQFGANVDKRKSALIADVADLIQREGWRGEETVKAVNAAIADSGTDEKDRIDLTGIVTAGDIIPTADKLQRLTASYNEKAKAKGKQTHDAAYYLRGMAGDKGGASVDATLDLILNGDMEAKDRASLLRTLDDTEGAYGTEAKDDLQKGLDARINKQRTSLIDFSKGRAAAGEYFRSHKDLLDSSGKSISEAINDYMTASTELETKTGATSQDIQDAKTLRGMAEELAKLVEVQKAAQEKKNEEGSQGIITLLRGSVELDVKNGVLNLIDVAGKATQAGQ